MADYSGLVALVKAGETCISDECMEHLGGRGQCKDIAGEDYQGAKLLTGLNLESSIVERMEIYVEDTLVQRVLRRDMAIEETIPVSSNS
jgi:hypothetical protein